MVKVLISSSIRLLLESAKVLLDFASEVIAGCDDLLDNASVSAVLALQQLLFSLILQGSDGLVDHLLLLGDLGLHHLFGGFEQLDKHVFITEVLKLEVEHIWFELCLQFFKSTFWLSSDFELLLLFQSMDSQHGVEVLSFFSHKLDVLDSLFLHLSVDKGHLILELGGCNLEGILEQHFDLHQIVLKDIDLLEHLSFGLLNDHVVIVLWILLNVPKLMLLKTQKLPDQFNAVLLCLQFRITHLLGAICNNVHLFFVVGLHLGLELDVVFVNGFVESSPVFRELTEHP